MTGFISGCFDNLHPGHIHILSEAKKRCKYLYVALNTDKHIETAKRRKPMRGLVERVSDLNKTGLADKIFIFDGDSPLHLIKRFKPNIIFVGDDYTIDRVVGAEEIKEWAGSVVFIPRIPGHSSTEIWKRLNA